MESPIGKLIPRKSPKLLSIVVPIYNEEESLHFLRQALTKLADDMVPNTEWILVNDGSTDKTLDLLIEWAKSDNRAKIIDFARNFGHQAAVTAGLDHANGEAVIVMDADLQDPPSLVPKMVTAYEVGYDVVYAQRTKRLGEGPFKRYTASLFYYFMRKFINRNMPMNVGDFRLMSRQACLALSHLREEQRFIRGMVSWLGFNQTGIEFERPARIAGKTKYPFRKMLRLAWNSVISFSSAPLTAGIYSGMIFFCFGSLLALHATVLKLQGSAVPGWASILVGQFMVGGVILCCLGLIGCYVGRIYEELKYRPIYIVRATANIEFRPLPPRAVPNVGIFLAEGTQNSNSAAQDAA